MASLLQICEIVFAQAQVSFRGLVTDESGTPLAGVNIRVDNSLTDDSYISCTCSVLIIVVSVFLPLLSLQAKYVFRVQLG